MDKLTILGFISLHMYIWERDWWGGGGGGEGGWKEGKE